MKIDHIAIYVNELEKTRKFYEKYFGAISNEKYRNMKTGLETYFLSFEDGSRLEIMTKADLHYIEKTTNNCGYIHLAFQLGSKEKVDVITKELEDDGYLVVSQPRITGDGYYESCIRDCEANILELVK